MSLPSIGLNILSYKWWDIWIIHKSTFLCFCSSINCLFLLCGFCVNSFFIFYNFTEIHVSVSVWFNFQSFVVYSEKLKEHIIVQSKYLHVQTPQKPYPLGPHILSTVNSLVSDHPWGTTKWLLTGKINKISLILD